MTKQGSAPKKSSARQRAVPKTTARRRAPRRKRSLGVRRRKARGPGRPRLTAADFWKRVRRSAPADCWPWLQARDACGYGRVSFRRFPAKRLLGAHRVAYALAHGLRSLPARHVLHTCDNPPCCNPRHLFLGTHLDNMRDCVSKGRFRSREDHPRAKLTRQKVRQIRRAYRQAKGTQQALGQRYGISQSYVSSVVNHRAWPNSDEPVHSRKKR